MAPYESDSDSEDDENLTTTNVTLGYVSSETTGDDISHVGGHPAWLDSKSRPNSSLVRCKMCNNYMSLLLQLNADLQQHFPNDQRRIQIWTCKKKACARKPGSVRAVREVKKGILSRSQQTQRPQPMQPQSSTNIGGALFGGTIHTANDNINPFSTDTGQSDGPQNPFGNLAPTSTLAAKPPQPPESQEHPPTESFAQKLRLNEDRVSKPTHDDSWPENEQFPEPFKFFYLDAYPEELDPEPESGPVPAVESTRVQFENDDGASSAADKDTFESTLDKTFQKFSDIISQNPEQVLRYEFRGQPLLYSAADAVSSRFVVPHGKLGAVKGMPRCEGCGSQRVFEMQLTPYLIYEIEKEETIDIDSGMDWGTVIVGVCTNNCGEEGNIAFREEWVGVQWEERVNRR